MMQILLTPKNNPKTSPPPPQKKPKNKNKNHQQKAPAHKTVMRFPNVYNTKIYTAEELLLPTCLHEKN